MHLHENIDYLDVRRRFPHIGKMIKLHWGHASFDKMMFDLMNDTRGGTRQGFPVEIGAALLRLSSQHTRDFPHLAPTDMWSDAHNPKHMKKKPTFYTGGVLDSLHSNNFK